MAPSAAFPHLPVPGLSVVRGSGDYAGFNSLDLQEIYVVERQRAVRTQIARGWGKPIIVRLPGGDLLASQYKNLEAQRNPAYPRFVCETALCRSTDEGLTWSEPRCLGLPGRVAQFSGLADGTLVVAAEPCIGGPLHWSADEGTTWQACSIDWTGMPVPPERRFFGETNGITALPDGTLVCGFYTSDDESHHATSWVLRSRDGARTWGDPTPTGRGSETCFVVLPDGRLLGFVRSGVLAGEGGASLWITESRDWGYTWSPQRGFGLGPALVPGFPVLLPDGRLLLAYGHRQFPFGAQAIASRDGGATWDLDHPIVLAWFSWDSYCGHPRTLLLPDGSLITGYYTRIYQGGTPNTDVVSHCLRWRAPAGWPPSGAHSCQGAA